MGLTIAVAAVTALLVAAGTAFGMVRLTGSESGATPVVVSPGSTDGIGQTSVPGVPVEGSSIDSPDWPKVVDAVQASVVAIVVNDGAGAGSGVVIDADGLVLTNNHVVSGASTVAVILADGRIYAADIVGTDVTTDLAVVRLVDASDLSPAALGDSDTVVVGQEVLAIGNPLGLQNTVTAGIVSALNRPVTVSDGVSEDVVTSAIQIDAAINMGNSGGPLFDGEGRVIGINSSIVSVNDGSIGLGFAIPVNLAKNIATQLVENGSAQHAFLGVKMRNVTATADGVTRSGAQVVSVNTGSPAAAAGLAVDDVIVALDGKPTPGADALTAYVRSLRAGDTVTLTIIRGGASMDVVVTLAVREEGTQPEPEPPP